MSHSIGWLGQPLFSTRFKGNRASWTTSWFPFSPFQASASFFQLWRIKRWHFLAAAVVTVSLVNKVYRRIIDALDERLRFKRVLRDQMEHASSYQQWKQLAGSLEELETQDAKTHRASQRAHYDEALLKEKVAALKHLASPEHLACLPQPSSSPLPEPNSQANVNPRDLMFSLRMDLVRNIANIAKNGLNEQTPSIPVPVKAYIHEVRSMLHQIRDWPASQLPYAEKLSFLRETRHTFGRTALLLSGGGSLGTFHMGVCKALFEAHLLPKVLAGSSAGSIVCAIIATRTDIELSDMFSRIHQFDMNFFNNSSGVELVKHLIKNGSLQDISFMIKRLRALLGELTFLEAFERTGRILNVTVCPADEKEPPKLLNYLTSPHALVWSAVAASSAFPGLYPAQHLLARSTTTGEIVTFSAHSGDGGLDRKWRDGSLEMDLPAQALGEMFNCNHYIVSQTNPHIVPLLNIKKNLGDGSKVGNILEAELKHRCQVLQWLLPQWLPSKWLSLFTQPWEGDITMMLPMDVWNLNKAIVNPSRDELVKLIKVGELAAWQKMAAIECNCSVEATLDACLSKVSNEMRMGVDMHHVLPARSSTPRIPSWLHMAHLGGINGHPGESVSPATQPLTSENMISSWGEMDKL